MLVRARKSSACNNGTHGDLACKSYVERTIWDGDQILIEKRMDGASGLSSGALDYGSGGSSEAWGEVLSVHAHGIDQPVAVRKLGATTLVPHANWMGDYEIGTTANGTVTSSCNGASNCPLILWPGSRQTVDGQLVSHSAINTWWGSLITEKTDPSGYKYMRNRYYNPQTGQFTQQDPIGLAGGVNLYGYAGGDPVNFSDPFGLDCRVSATGQPCPRPSLSETFGPLLTRIGKALVAEIGTLTGLGGCGGDVNGQAVICGTPPLIMPSPSGAASTLSRGSRFPTDAGQLRHIFRRAEGHVADTPGNRRLFQQVADNTGNYVGTDRFGNSWAAQTLQDGRQVWVQTRNGVIRNGGINDAPRGFDPERGLAR